MPRITSTFVSMLVIAVVLALPGSRVAADAGQHARMPTFTLHDAQVSGFIAVDAHGNVYADSGKDLGYFWGHGGPSTVVKFSPKGKVLAAWAGLGANGDSPDQAGGIALDSLGNVYAVDTSANCIVKLSSSLTVISPARWVRRGPWAAHRAGRIGHRLPWQPVGC